MKKLVIVGAAALAAWCGLGAGYVSNPAKAAHRLTDEQIYEVISKAPTGASVTVPADFFRDVIAGKYRWRNATNWIERASGDATMVTALKSMDDERLKEIGKREDAQSHTNALHRRIAALTNKVESVKREWRHKWEIATNNTAAVTKRYGETVNDLIQTRIRESDAVQKFYEFREKFLALDAKMAGIKNDIIAKRAEIQEKYDDATFLTKAIYKLFLDIIDNLLEEFETQPLDEDEMSQMMNEVVAGM